MLCESKRTTGCKKQDKSGGKTDEWPPLVKTDKHFDLTNNKLKVYMLTERLI